jgi:hypothetical protein
MRNRKNQNLKNEKRNGHAYALIDLIYAQKSKNFYIKLRNCQKNVKIFKEISNE